MDKRKDVLRIIVGLVIVLVFGYMVFTAKQLRIWKCYNFSKKDSKRIKAIAKTRIN